MKMLSLITLTTLLSLGACSHNSKSGCGNKESCSRHSQQKSCCKEKKECCEKKEACCKEQKQECKDGSCEKKAQPAA